MEKFCTKCKQTKDVSLFYKNSCTKDGKSYWCKVCANGYIKHYYKTTSFRQYVLDKSKQRQKEKAKEVSEYKKQWRQKNIIRLLDYDKQRYLKSKHVYIERVAKRKAKKLQATPKWADVNLMRAYYAMSKLLDKLNPFVKHHVDHIVPLQNKFVCGLHTHTNLQILTAKQNMEKSNKFSINQ
jgi:hypothetical protein